MNKTVGMLAVFAFSFALHAFGEEAVENVFSSEDTRPLNDPAGWSLGAVPSSEKGAVISGKGAFLVPEIQGFSSYSLKSGAALLVGPGSMLSDMTLEAGSKLQVDTKVIYEKSGYITKNKDNPTSLGGMPVSYSLQRISDITGCIGGATWSTGLQGTPYSNVYLFEYLEADGVQTQICQFQNYIANFDGNHTKGVVVEIKKDLSGNITAYVQEARYFNARNGLSEDLRTGMSFSSADSDGGGGYGVKDVAFSVPIAESHAPVAMNEGTAFSVVGEGVVEIDVAEKCILDLSRARVSAEASIVKTGKGAIVIGPELTGGLRVESGILAVQLGVSYDMSKVTLAEDVEIMGFSEGDFLYVRGVPAEDGKIQYLKTEGAFEYSGAEEIPSNGFTALSVSGENTVFVLDSSVPVETLAEVVVDSGSTLKIDSQIDIKKLTLNGFACLIVGENGNLKLRSFEVTAQNDSQKSSMKVMSGGKMKIFGDGALPYIELNGSASLEIDSRVSMSEWDFSESMLGEGGEFGVFPRLTICKYGILSVPGDTKFKNVNMTVKGTIEASSAGAIYFGYAKSGEVSRFGLLADGASFKMADGVENGKGGYYFASPEQGGRVKVAGAIRIKDSNFNLAEKMGAVEKYQGFCFGKNNPVDEPLLVDITGTVIDCTANSYIGGSAVVSFGDGGVMRNPINNAQSGRASHIYVVDKARLVFGEGSQFLYPISGNWTGSGINFSPDDDEYPALELKNGGAFASYVTKGNGKARVDFKSAFFEVICGTWHGNDRLSHVFWHFKAAHVSKGDMLTIRRAKYDIGGNQFDNVSIVTDIVAPIKGDGDVVVTNATKNSFSLIVQRGDNENTGRISAHGENCQLWFADGANWKGTVVANGKTGISAIYYKNDNNGIEGETPYIADGKVNADGAIPYPLAPVTVAFAKLDLQSDFPVKVWKDENGKISGNDVLNVGEYINNGGRLVPTLAGDGEFVLGDKIVVGEIGDSSPLPRVPKGWMASRKTIDGKSMLMLSKGVGFLMIVR